jgi:hypothetical protein
MIKESTDSYKSEYLYNAIDDANNTIRFLDTKIGAVFVGISLCITLLQLSAIPIQNLYVSLSKSIFLHVLFVFICISYSACLVLSVTYGFLTIKPQRTPKIQAEGKELVELWYISTLEKGKDIPLLKYFHALKFLTEEGCILSILSELLKLSYIRNLKFKSSNLCFLFFIYSLVPLGLLFLCIILYGTF